MNELLSALFERIDVGTVVFDGGIVEGKRTKSIGIGHIDLFREFGGQFVEGKTDIPAFGIFQSLFDETSHPCQLLRTGAQFAQHLLDCAARRVLVVEFHAKAGR